MKKHTKIYLDYYEYGEQDTILCEYCRGKANDIHHIKFKSRGGKDNIENLIALCRRCHDKAHNEPKFNKDLRFRKSEIEFK